MKLVYFIVPIFFLYFSSLHAELNCQLEVPSKEVLALGMPVELQIVFWPKEEFSIDSFRQSNRDGAELVSSFYINQTYSVKPSVNNEQAVVISLEVVPIKAFDTKILPMYSDGINSCLLKLENVTFSTEKIKPQIVILAQPSDPLPGKTKNILYSFISILVLFLIVALAYLGRRFFIKKRASQRLQLRKDFFRHLFKNAKSREEFEKLYVLRDEWLKLLPAENSDIYGFFTILNKIQYQKSWSEQELEQCEEAFGKIREVWNA